MNAPAKIVAGPLWSLLDVLDRYALLFSDLAVKLLRLEEYWGDNWLGANPRPMTGDTEDQVRFREWRNRDTLAALESLRKLSVQVQMDQLVPEIARLYTSVRAASENNIPLLNSPSEALGHLRDRIKDELAQEHFVHVPRTDIGLYGKPEPFGAKVTAALAASEDLEAAGNCLAVGQPTACVFHLMRVMEKAVHRLESKVKAKVDPQRRWFVICNNISTAVTNRAAKTPAQRRKNAALGAAASHLNVVRLAWRNEVMHPKQTYTQDEAREVYNACRAFLTDLAELV